MDIINYVCVDIASEYPLRRMIYYKYHRNMDVLHYVCVDVPSENPVQ